MGQLCLALAPKHPKITFFRPSSQTPLPTPDTLRHAIGSAYTPPIPLATAALLKGVRIEYAWKGNGAFTFDLLPHGPPSQRHALRDGVLRTRRRDGKLPRRLNRRDDREL
jgi:hypothetical protein